MGNKDRRLSIRIDFILQGAQNWRPRYMVPLLCSLLLLLSGCASAHFIQYSGAQQDWPTAPGGFVETKYEVPAYFGPPSKPYEVLGYLDARTAPVRRRGVVRYAAARAKQLGGDAIIVLHEGSEYVGTYNSGSAYTSGSVSGYSSGNSFYGTGNATTSYSGTSTPMFAGRASVIIIKFKQLADAPKTLTVPSVTTLPANVAQ